MKGRRELTAAAGPFAFQLGIALIAFFFVVRAIEHHRVAGSTPANGSVHETTVPDAASAQRALVRMFWTGVALVVLGLILQESQAAWQYDLSGTADVGAGLARDILWLVGAPLEAVAVPLGILLAAGSLVPRTLELANTEHCRRGSLNWTTCISAVTRTVCQSGCWRTSADTDSAARPSGLRTAAPL